VILLSFAPAIIFGAKIALHETGKREAEDQRCASRGREPAGAWSGTSGSVIHFFDIIILGSQRLR
jgi:hypothetical protein